MEKHSLIFFFKFIFYSKWIMLWFGLERKKEKMENTLDLAYPTHNIEKEITTEKSPV